MASDNPVENFLEKIGLQMYRSRLQSQGYDTVFDLCLLDEEDLDSLSIRDPDDRSKILQAGRYIYISKIYYLSVLIFMEYIS